jgi:hypothetical protein
MSSVLWHVTMSVDGLIAGPEIREQTGAIVAESGQVADLRYRALK